MVDVADVLVPGQGTLIVVSASALRADEVQEIQARTLSLEADIGFLVGDEQAPWTRAVESATKSSPLETAATCAWFDEDFDPPFGAAGIDDPSLTPERLLTEPWHVLIVRGHGDGSHLKAGTAILCGCRERAESVAGIAVADGCRAHPTDPFCKRSRIAGWTAVPASSVAARIVVLLSCNSVATDGALYPSASSIALGILEAGAQAVLGTTRALDFDAALIARVSSALDAGVTIGGIARLLNRELAMSGQAPAYTLLGSPQAGLSRSGPSLEFVPARSARPSWDVDAEAAGAVFLSSSGATVIGDRSAGVADRGLELDRVCDNLEDYLARIARMARWDFNLRMTAAADAAASEELVDLIAARARAEDAVRFLDLSVGQALNSSRWLPQIEEFGLMVRNALDLWSDVAARLIERSLIYEVDVERGRLRGDRVHQSLVLGAHRQRADERACCDKCSSLMATWHLNLAGRGAPPTALRECPVCGPRSISDTLEVRTSLSKPFSRGTRSRFTVSTVMQGDGDLDGEATAIVQVRDKSRMDPVLTRRVQLVSGRAEFDIPVDVGAGSDMWSIRTVAVHSGAIAYDRRVVACVS
ncbi:hypothetical protein EOC94_02835 [Mesorhizobium sp. M6A.T.Ce.TU.016.01.1.1]|nr:hypothetical protein EOC94_02835 [Mesorhizobium sp. M6A.T.Ce.TU.016.01.1.1]